MNLLETYRDVMAHLDVASTPQRAIERGFYVERPESLATELAKSLLLAPASTQLVVGGIGSGKSTELLLTQQLINKNADTRAIYVDVSTHHDLRQLKAGVLLSIAGVVLGEGMIFGHAAYDAAERLRVAARGEVVAPYALQDDDGIYQPGLLRDPGPSYASMQLAEPLTTVLTELRTRVAHHILLFDALDRVHDLRAFQDVVRDDVAVLRRLGVGVVVVAPQGILYGPERSLVQAFDEYTFLWDIDVEQSPVGQAFLQQVLSARIPAAMLPEECSQRLVTASGGVLRDLLGLAKAAAQRAFFQDAAQISLKHVETAVAQAGQKLLFGVTKEGKTTLIRLAHGWPFALATANDLELLDTRRVLQYRLPDGQPRFVLNPLLRPLLARSPSKPGHRQGGQPGLGT